MKYVGVLLAIIIFILLTCWTCSPAWNCEGTAVRGVFRYECIEDPVIDK